MFSYSIPVEGPITSNLSISGALWTESLVSWIHHFSRGTIDIDLWTKCRATSFLFFFCITFSSALLVIISVEKFIALYFPLKSKIICTVQIAKRISLVTGIILALFNSQFIFLIDIRKTGNGHEYCYFTVPKSYFDVLTVIIMPILHSYGPFTIIIIVNGAIICKFAAAKWRNSQGHSSSTDQALSKSAVKGTIMLLTVSFTFILLTGPIAILQAIIGEWGSPPLKIYIATQLLSYSNHAINSVLYCVSGSRFRKELIKTICCCKTNRQRNSRQNRGAINQLPFNNATGSPI